MNRELDLTKKSLTKKVFKPQSLYRNFNFKLNFKRKESSLGFLNIDFLDIIFLKSLFFELGCVFKIERKKKMMTVRMELITQYRTYFQQEKFFFFFSYLEISKWEGIIIRQVNACLITQK